MRLAVVSDIHGNLPALEAVIAEIVSEGVDNVVNLGDIASGPLWPAETVARLGPLGWTTIRGNHERQVLGEPAAMGASDAYAAARLDAAARDWFAGLPATSRLAEGEVFACHGTPTSDHDYLLETVTTDWGVNGSTGVRAASAAEVAARLGGLAAEVVMCGHSHRARVAWSDGRLLVNPGSLGMPGFDETRPHFHVIEAGSPHARWALLERTAAGWQTQLRCTTYDWTAAARKAEAEGRGDWADVLANGRVGRTEETPQ